MDLKYPELSEITFSESIENALRKDTFLARKLANVAKNLHQLRLDSRNSLTNYMSYYSSGESYKVGQADWMKNSKTVLEDIKTPAGVLLIAARNVLGPAINTFEPDTIHIELEKHEGLKVPSGNFDKLLAAIILTETPAFYFEANCFKNTVMAFNNQHMDPEVLQEPNSAHIAWAVYEAEIILHENALWEPSFEDDPTVFTAAVLHREGMILAPDILSFSQVTLDSFNKGNSGPKKDEVKTAWEAIKDKSNLKDKKFEETPVDIQLSKLSACQIYLSEQADSYQEILNKLK